jgi:hypothetical protein
MPYNSLSLRALIPGASARFSASFATLPDPSQHPMTTAAAGELQIMKIEFTLNNLLPVPLAERLHAASRKKEPTLAGN